MMTEGQRELEATQEFAGNEADKLTEQDSVSTNDMENLDESGAVEAAEYGGKQIQILPPLPKADQEDDAQEEPVPEVESEPKVVVQKDKYVKKLPITHLKNPENKRVFEATPDLMKRRDLIPCNEDGKKVYDHRLLN